MATATAACLFPFIALTIATAFDHADVVFWSQALFSYGAVILTFVGALHWGFALAIPEFQIIKKCCVDMECGPNIGGMGSPDVRRCCHRLRSDHRIYNTLLARHKIAQRRFPSSLLLAASLLQITVVACICMGLGTAGGDDLGIDGESRGKEITPRFGRLLFACAVSVVFCGVLVYLVSNELSGCCDLSWIDSLIH